jgi:hypothetical protein
MLSSAKASVETKKSWVAPELKKTDIEKITASGGNNGATDGYYVRS